MKGNRQLSHHQRRRLRKYVIKACVALGVMFPMGYEFGIPIAFLTLAALIAVNSVATAAEFRKTVADIKWFRFEVIGLGILLTLALLLMYYFQTHRPHRLQPPRQNLAEPAGTTPVLPGAKLL